MCELMCVNVWVYVTKQFPEVFQLPYSQGSIAKDYATRFFLYWVFTYTYRVLAALERRAGRIGARRAV